MILGLDLKIRIRQSKYTRGKVYSKEENIISKEKS
jgi:hypothetical protein